MASAPTMSTITDGVNNLQLRPALTVDLPIRPKPTTAILGMAPVLSHDADHALHAEPGLVHAALGAQHAGKHEVAGVIGDHLLLPLVVRQRPGEHPGPDRQPPGLGVVAAAQVSGDPSGGPAVPGPVV